MENNSTALVENKPEVIEKRPKERIYYFDNCKFVLIFFVVLAHAVSPLISNYPWLKNIWVMLNAFHMPTFIFISGYFAKKYIRKDGSFNIQKPFTYLLLYLASQIAVTLFELFALKKNIKISFLYARSSLWFLQGLFIYFIILPYIAKLNKKFVIIFAFACAIIMGYDYHADVYLNIMRGFVHFPFFMLGYYAREDFFWKIKENKIRIPLIICSLVLIALICNINKMLPTQLVECKYNYYDMKFNWLPIQAVWLYRVEFYIIAITFGLTFLSIMPKDKIHILSKFGTRTLQVYILHRFIYLAELQYNWAKYFDSSKRIYLLMLVAVIVTIVLSLKIFEYPFKLIQGIKIDRFLSKEAKTSE